MKKTFLLLLSFALVILFLIQLSGTLVESIYILDLMNLHLDEKALGLLFFFLPALALPFFKRYPRPIAWASTILLIVTRGLLPYLSTSTRMPAAGIGTAAALTLFLLLLSARTKAETVSDTRRWGSAGFALALALSIFLRVWGSGLDLSLIPRGGWIAWLLGLLLVVALSQLDWQTAGPPAGQKQSGGLALAGVMLLLTLAWFSFSAPAVIARWTQGNYTFIVAVTSLFACGFVALSLFRPGWMAWPDRRTLVWWNVLFTLSLTATLLANSVPFPPAPESAPVVVSAPGWFAQLALALTLLLSPIIFLDMRIFLEPLSQSSLSLGGFLLGTLIMVMLIFAHIFTNVWGYVPPVSTLFRGKFWLVYFVLAGLITWICWRTKYPDREPVQEYPGTIHPVWALLLAGLFLATSLRAWPRTPESAELRQRSSLLVMTYNTQQSNDDAGERSFERQLALIRKVSPDVLALQESDSTRPSLNNNDYVRYFAEQLGYYSYYGPVTVNGTYGTALLSKFPLLRPRTAYSYSDRDEIGTTEAEIEVGGLRITIYDVHPDGTDTAMLAFARVLVGRSQGQPYIIALGDFNLRPDEEAYKLIHAVYPEAWSSVYPSAAQAQGLPSPGEKRIDHIFISPSLQVRNPVYVLPPDSATDHPVHWAEVFWQAP